LFEFSVDHAVRETLSADTNAFQDTVTGQLMHNQMGIENTTGLDFIRDDTTNEVRMSLFQSVHQFVQLFLNKEMIKVFLP